MAGLPHSSVRKLADPCRIHHSPLPPSILQFPPPRVIGRIEPTVIQSISFWLDSEGHSQEILQSQKNRFIQNVI